MSRCSALFWSVLFLVAVCPTMASVIRVPLDQPTIQAGLDAASAGDTVLVADGRYTGPGNRDIDFGGKAVVLVSENGPENCVIDAEGSVAREHWGVRFTSGEGPGSVLSGFTIFDAHVHDDFGGGIVCDQSSPTITGNWFIGNTSEGLGSGGAGIGCINSANPTISGNIFRDNMGTAIKCRDMSSPVIIDNEMTGNSVGGIGGSWNCHPLITRNYIHDNPCEGMGFSFYSSPTITYNIIANNHYSGISAVGGGLFVADSNSLIMGNTISGNYAQRSGGGIVVVGGNPVITGNIIEGNECGDNGGGIDISVNGHPVFTNNLVRGNVAGAWGGGIYCANGMTLSDNLIIGNHAAEGGGLYLNVGAYQVTVENNLIVGNSADENGGGMKASFLTDALFRGNTIAGNHAANNGGGIYCYGGSNTVINTVLWGNSAAYGAQLWLGGYSASVTVTYSAVEGGEAAVYIEPDTFSDLFWEAGNLVSDPLFTQGPWHDYWLSQTAAGQAVNSPCLDAGDPASALVQGSTRTDLVADAGVVDIGYHHRGGVQVAAGPGPGYGNPPLVRLLPPVKGAAASLEFSAYGPPHYGVNVACGDIDGDGVDELVTGPGPGDVFGPHVRGWEAGGTAMGAVSFLAYGTNRFGVNVACGDIDGDGVDELVTGAGPGEVFGPHVRGWDYDGTPPVRPLAGVSYFAYGTLKHGVNVSCGDIDGDGIDEIVTAPGPSPAFGSHVRGWNHDGSSVTPLDGFSFFAWAPGLYGSGARVFAGGDLDGDGRNEVLVAPGPDPSAPGEIRVYRYESGESEFVMSLEAFDDGYTHGASVAAGRF